MTKLEQKQEELIQLLRGQAIDLSMMSKIEFGDDVIQEWTRLSIEIETLKENGEMVNYIKLDEYKTWSDNQEYVLRIFLKHSEIAYLVINFQSMYDKVKNNEKIPFDNGYYIFLRTLEDADKALLEALGILVEERGV